uniref:Uncharacterized protein n=1 Tax=Triticum urartu TaxID=4572 RepID=A0A8R7V4P9_TRIUA
MQSSWILPDEELSTHALEDCMMCLPNRNWYHKNYVTAEFLYIGASIDMFPDDVMLSCILVTDLARQTDYVPLLDIACFEHSDFLCVSAGKLCV